ncbi:ECF-type sigma factor [Planctomycetaceae bacterium SH139]
MTKSPASITVCFEQLRLGDSVAAEKLWHRFFERLVVYARSQMQHANRRVSDEEDIACGVMAALCDRAEKGQLPDIDNRADLWHLLLSWTRHDIIDHVRKENRLKRGGGKVRGDSVFLAGPGTWSTLLDNSPSPSLIAEMEEQYSRLLTRLPDPILRRIAADKMRGVTNSELARELEVSKRTVERKIDLIRKYWGSDRDE